MSFGQSSIPESSFSTTNDCAGELRRGCVIAIDEERRNESGDPQAIRRRLDQVSLCPIAAPCVRIRSNDPMLVQPIRLSSTINFD